MRYNARLWENRGCNPQEVGEWYENCSLMVAMINEKVLDWIEGYVLTRMIIFGDFVGTVNRTELMFDLDTSSEYFRIYEGQRIQALSLPVKSRRLCNLLGEIEACFQRGWDLLDAGDWEETDFDEVYELSRQISDEIMTLREEFKRKEVSVSRQAHFSPGSTP